MCPPSQTTLAHALRPHAHPVLARQSYSSPVRLTPEPLDGQGAVRLALTWDEILQEYSAQQSSRQEPQLDELSEPPAAAATAAAAAAVQQPSQQLPAMPTSQLHHYQQQAPDADELLPAPTSFNPAAGNPDAFRPLDVTILCWTPYDGSGLEQVAGQRWIAISFMLLNARLAAPMRLQVCASIHVRPVWDTVRPFDLASPPPGYLVRPPELVETPTALISPFCFLLGLGIAGKPLFADYCT